MSSRVTSQTKMQVFLTDWLGPFILHEQKSGSEQGEADL